MLIPMNFAVGAIVGAAVAYVYKDDSAKEALGSTGEKLKSLFKKKTEAVEDQETVAVEGQDAEPAEVVAEATDATAADVATDVKADVADKGADASKKSAKS